MKRSDVVRMAREAGCPDIVIPREWFRFAKLVEAKEREACADIAENWRCNGMPRTVLADQIRQRGRE
jgi:hypothetical protein